MATESVLERSDHQLSDLARRDRMNELFAKAYALMDLMSAMPESSLSETGDNTISGTAWVVRDMLYELKTLAR